MVRGSQAPSKTDRPADGRAERYLCAYGVGWLALAGLLLALARLPLIRCPVDVSPDGCEYLGISRHLVAEHRWVSSLKWNFFTDAPVIHAALTDRPPLYPLWAAGWMALSARSGTQIWLARAGNLLLAAGLPAVLFWALQPAVADAAAALAALIFALYPGFVRNSAQPLTEPLFLLLLFGSLGRFLRARSSLDWSISGILAGLSFLTRPTGIVLPALYSAVLLTHRHGGRPTAGREECPSGSRLAILDSGRRRPLFLMLLGFVLPLLPYFIAVAAQTGSPFNSILRYNYSIRHIDEGTLNGFERSFEPPLEFVARHAREIAPLIAVQWETMGTALGRSLQYLLPLVVFVRPWRWEWKPATLLGLALLNYLLHAMSWAVWGAARYMFPSYIACAALLLDAPLRWLGNRARSRAAPTSGSERSVASTMDRVRAVVSAVVLVSVALTLTACLRQDARLYQEKLGPGAGVHLGWAYAEAGQRLESDPDFALCAANQPWIVNLLADRPAIMAPRYRDEAQLRRYLRRYRPDHLVLFVTSREPQDVATASRLVDGLWTQPKLLPELADVLELDSAHVRVTRIYRQALLMFRVRQRER